MRPVTPILTVAGLLMLSFSASAAVIHLNTAWNKVPPSGLSSRWAIDTYDAPDQMIYWGLNFGAPDWHPWEWNRKDGIFYFAIYIQDADGARFLLRSGSANRRWTTGGFHATPHFIEVEETGAYAVVVRRFGDPVRVNWRSYLAEGYEGEYVPELTPWPFLEGNVDISTDFEDIETVLANPHYEFTLVRGEIPEPSTWLLMMTGLPLLIRAVRRNIGR